MNENGLCCCWSVMDGSVRRRLADVVQRINRVNQLASFLPRSLLFQYVLQTLGPRSFLSMDFLARKSIILHILFKADVVCVLPSTYQPNLCCDSPCPNRFLGIEEADKCDPNSVGLFAVLLFSGAHLPAGAGSTIIRLAPRLLPALRFN